MVTYSLLKRLTDAGQLSKSPITLREYSPRMPGSFGLKTHLMGVDKRVSDWGQTSDMAKVSNISIMATA